MIRMANKYGNRQVVIDGIPFDSRREANRWRELLLLQRAGAIRGLDRQVKFELIPAQYETFERYSDKTEKRLKDGKRLVENACTYIADFVYEERIGDTWKKVVEDAKGCRTKEYILKRKLMLYVHGIRIVEV